MFTALIFGGGIATVLLWLVLCALAAALAEKKGHKGIGYFLLAIFLSPLIGLLVVAAISNRNQKECPYCFKAIDIRATVCSYCCSELANSRVPSKPKGTEKDRRISGSGSVMEAEKQAEEESSANEGEPREQ